MKNLVLLTLLLYLFAGSDYATSTAADQATTSHIVMVGDVLLHDRVEESAESSDGIYDFSPIFDNVRSEIETADLAIANQEVIIGGSELGVSGYPAFNAPYQVADELVRTGFDVICHGTNHALDKGKKGILNCLDYWDKTYPNVEVLGIHNSSADQSNITVVDSNGINIAILNYTYGTNGITLPSDMPYAVDLLNEKRVIEDLAWAEQNADFTIVCPHWGTEYRLSPDSSQEYWAKLFCQNGADLIIGTHPHVIEPIEVIHDEATGNETLVYYSIGNFVNWTSGEGTGVSNRMVGGMADITLIKENGVVSISDYTIDALVSHVTSGTGGVSTYFLRDYTESLAVQNEIRKQDSDFSYEYILNLCNTIWQDQWK